MTLVLNPSDIVQKRVAEGKPGLLACAEGWERRNVSELCRIINGAPFPSADFNRNGKGMPLIRIRDVGRSETETFFDGPYPESALVSPGDLLVGMDGDFRLARWAGPPALLNQRVCKVVVESPLVDEDFLELVLPGYLDAIWEETSATTVKHLSSKSVGQIPIPLPSLSEQQQISGVLGEQLSRLDAAVKSVQTVREKAAQFRLSLLEDAVVRGKFDERSEQRRIVELGDLVDAKNDIVDGPFGSNLKSEHYTSEGARVIRLQNIGYGEFRDERAFISQDHFHRLQKHNVLGGDLLFASLGENLPRTCLMPDIDEQAIVKADCIRVRLSSKVDRRYVLHATQTPTARQWALEQLHGLGRPRLGLGNIRKFPVVLPSLWAQQRIAELIDLELERVSRALMMADEVERKAKALRRSLLHAAFSGELTRSWREALV